MINQSSSQNSTSSYKCKECRDTEWIVGEGNIARPCKCREINQYQRLLDNSNLSEDFKKKCFENYITSGKPKVLTTAKKLAIEYVKEFESTFKSRHNSIALLGQVGCGKTHLSIAISNALIQSGHGVLYMQYRETIMQLKQNIMEEEYYQSEINKFKRASVLLIDDLYKGKVLEADYNIMFELINYRYLKNLPIIVSSEFLTDNLLSRDEAIGSRIIEMCKGRIIEFEGSELNFRLNG